MMGVRKKGQGRREMKDSFGQVWEHFRRTCMGIE